ncbi:hypothetical protein B0H14DRAFT_2615724 [Mycena olivaceomarginata]|nr:hypothetical protein B0H14DRAFT_2615724 [Mycena olivaceomarginata]
MCVRKLHHGRCRMPACPHAPLPAVTLAPAPERSHPQPDRRLPAGEDETVVGEFPAAWLWNVRDVDGSGMAEHTGDATRGTGGARSRASTMEDGVRVEPVNERGWGEGQGARIHAEQCRAPRHARHGQDDRPAPPSPRARRESEEGIPGNERGRVRSKSAGSMSIYVPWALRTSTSRSEGGIGAPPPRTSRTSSSVRRAAPPSLHLSYIHSYFYRAFPSSSISSLEHTLPPKPKPSMGMTRGSGTRLTHPSFAQGWRSRPKRGGHPIPDDREGFALGGRAHLEAKRRMVVRGKDKDMHMDTVCACGLAHNAEARRERLSPESRGQNVQRRFQAGGRSTQIV